MSPSSKYNGQTASTKAIKLQRNTRVSAASVLSPSSSSLSSASMTASSAALLLTSYMNSSSVMHHAQEAENDVAPFLPTTAEIITTLSSSKDDDNNAGIHHTQTKQVSRTMPSFKIMSYQNIIALLTVLVCGLATVNGLKCYMCGQYNEGVGSITPCTNYSDQYAHLYLKECSKKSEKYCVKYVSELSIVRDCATECAEKEIWETQTYCCTEDGCNGSSSLEATTMVVMGPLIVFTCNAIWNGIIKAYRR